MSEMEFLLIPLIEENGFEQRIKKILLDPDEETADIDTSNNSWPKKKDSKF